MDLCVDPGAIRCSISEHLKHYILQTVPWGPSGVSASCSGWLSVLLCIYLTDGTTWRYILTWLLWLHNV